jgi:hypothetical protein
MLKINRQRWCRRGEAEAAPLTYKVKKMTKTEQQLRGAFGVRWIYDAGASQELGVVLESWAPVALGLVLAWQMEAVEGGDVVVEVGPCGWQLRDCSGHVVGLLFEQVVALLDGLTPALRTRGLALERQRIQRVASVPVPVALPRPVASGRVAASSAPAARQVRAAGAWRQAAV